MRKLTRDECFEVLKKYDPELYEYYMKNAWFFGYNAMNYAAYLLREHDAVQEWNKDTEG